MKRKILYTASLLGGATAGGCLVKKLWKEKYIQQRNVLSLSQKESDLLYSWLQLSQEDVKISEYFTSHGFSKVAVFGMNREGRLAIEALGNLAVYGVELENPNAVHERLTVYRLGDDPLPPADCLVVCSMEWDEEMEAKIKKDFSGAIVTLSKVLEARNQT